MLKHAVSIFLATSIISFNVTAKDSNSLPVTDCVAVNKDLKLIEQLKESGQFRKVNEVTEESTFDFKSDLPFSNYLNFARKHIELLNPKESMPCPIESEITPLLYPGASLSKRTIADLIVPFEIPVEDSKTGILLIHGLTDSPYLFHDLSSEFHKQGLNVRTLLLPGHGTAPSALTDVKEKQWRQAANYAVRQMLKDFNQVYLGGFSTGGALLIDQLVNENWSKAEKEKVKGLLLWSPASRAKSDFAWAAQFVDYIPFMDYTNKSADIDLAKYESFSLNAGAQVHKLMNRINDSVDKNVNNIPNVPIFVIASEVDQTINTEATIDIVKKWHIAPNRNNRLDTLVYYGSSESLSRLPKSFNVYLPQCTKEEHCKQVVDVAHTAPTNSPANPHYGWKGSYRNCEMAKEYGECKTTQSRVFGETSSVNLEKFPNLQRLTFNPNYKQMVAEISKFIGDTRQD